MAVSLEVGERELQELTRLATTYALAHGLLYLPIGGVQPPAPTSAIHAPLAIFPTSFPRSKFSLAQKLQPLYNVLYARVATDEKFLDKVMGAVEGAGKVDQFTGQLWRCWKQLRDEGVQQVRTWTLDKVTRLTGSAGLAPGLVQVGLPPSQSRQWQGSFVETSRIQHHIVLVWGIILPLCCPPPVRVLSLSYVCPPYIQIQLPCQIHVVLRCFPRIQPRRSPTKRYPL